MPTVKKTVKKIAVKKTTVKTAAKVAKSVKQAVVKELPKEKGLKLSVYGVTGKVLESISLPKEIFGVEINKNIMAQAVRVYLANQRRGTVKTKSRGEVNISTRKLYKQKGTGRARHGAASAPIFVGGGIAFGPRPRDFSLKLSQKMRRVALFSALSSKVNDGEVRIVSGLSKLEPKTKEMAKVLEALDLNKNKKGTLLVMPKLEKNADVVVKAARNIEGVTVMQANLLNTYEVLKSREVLFMKEAIDTMKENFLK